MPWYVPRRCINAWFSGSLSSRRFAMVACRENYPDRPPGVEVPLTAGLREKVMNSRKFFRALAVDDPADAVDV